MYGNVFRLTAWPEASFNLVIIWVIWFNSRVVYKNDNLATSGSLWINAAAINSEIPTFFFSWKGFLLDLARDFVLISVLGSL